MTVCCSYINALPSSVYELNTANPTISTTAVRILAADNRRCSIIFHNHSGSIVDLGLTANVATNEGFFSLDVNDGQLWSWDNEGPIVQREWWAILAAGSGPLVVTQTRCIRFGVP